MKTNFDRKGSLLPVIGLFAVFLLFVQPYLFREFWFDEALTLMNFAWMPDPVKIYFSYIITNNQLLYTIALHYWAQLPFDGFRQDFFLRLLSLLFASGTILLLYSGFRRIYGKFALLLSLGAMTAAPPFLIYATALRGYMASAFFIALTLKFAVDFQRKPGKVPFLKYAAGCLLAVGTIPSNLLALAGVVLYALPFAGSAFLRKKRTFVLALSPLICLAVVYLPILKSFLGVCRLGEGWQNGCLVLAAWFCMIGAVFGLLWLPFLLFAFKPVKFYRMIPLGIFLLPVFAVCVLPTSPFPRVFFPLLPLIALLMAGALRRFAACFSRRYRKYLYSLSAVVILSGGYVLNTTPVKAFLSGYCGGPSGDDFFYGYYMRPEHEPLKTALELEKFFGRNAVLPPVYLSFASDPWPAMYYLTGRGFQAEFLFDGPRGKIAFLVPRSLVVINAKENPATVESRFGVELMPLFETRMHRVFRVK